MTKARTTKTSIKNEPAASNNNAASHSRKLKKPLTGTSDSVSSVQPKSNSNAAAKPPQKKSWASIAADAKELQLAVDTEFEGIETLAIQVALRINEEVVVQVYHSPGIPAPPSDCFLTAFTKQFATKVIVRPAKVITADLSPARVLADLLELDEAKYLTRYQGDARRQVHERAKAEELNRLKINVLLIAHALRADFLRAFGSGYYSSLLSPTDQSPSVAIRDSRVIGFAGTKGVADLFSSPVVEYVVDGEDLFELRLETLDTNCVCGSAKLDALAKSYLNIAKDESITDQDKKHMSGVFRDHQRRADAYRYAAQDAVITLLITEKMFEQHEQLYTKFDIPSDAIPRMHGTPGLRMANLVLQHARHTSASGSKYLGAKQNTKPAGLNMLKELARKGSADALSDGRVSRYGQQTGDTHGGLLQSRTPFVMFHEGVGQFRDIDLKSCYPAIIRPMATYFGRPIVLEPGHTTWTLKKAIEYVQKHADGDYAWMIKVSGTIEGFANTLIPSTIDAITNDNYRRGGRNRAARRANVAMLNRKKQDIIHEGVNDRKYTALFTDEVNAGIVTWATWLMIQALPPSVRTQYENLRAETIVFYPRKLVAGSGPEFDQLVEKIRTGHQVDWKQKLDLKRMTLTTVDDIDEKYVSLRYPVGQLTDSLIKYREEAGKDTAVGLMYKTLANTVYGVFASPFLPTSNPVTANVITGTARALAYAMNQTLNGLLVITDGVLYRRDRVPAGTFASLIRRKPDYPLLHEDDVDFVDPASIPNDDAAFTEWYIGRVLQFFGVKGRSEYETLFRLHTLVHKSIPDGGPVFDGVFVDGSANYGKLMLTKKRKWRVADMKARSFGKREQEILKKRLCKIYRTDQFEQPLELVPSGQLLNVRDALIQARRVVQNGPKIKSVVPLGFMQERVSSYKLIKISAFVFRNANQRKKILVDWRRLNKMTECGPELLARRRTYQGSLSAVTKSIYELIRAGEVRLKRLNVDRLWRPNSLGLKHAQNVCKKRAEARNEFMNKLIVAATDPRQLTGLVVDHKSIASIQAASTQVGR